MKKKDIFFVGLFMVCFLVCGIKIAGASLSGHIENWKNSNYVIAYAEEKKEDSTEPSVTEEATEGWETIQPGESISDNLTEQTSEDKTGAADKFSGNENAPIPGMEVPITEEPMADTPDTESPVAGEPITEDTNTEESPLTESTTEDTTAEESVTDAPNTEEPTTENSDPETVSFDDALFIGDSRTVGLMEYGNLANATFFAESGMSVFDLEKKPLSVPGEGKLSFHEVLTKKSYGKIYLMLGLNELGYPFENVQKKYRETLEKIRQNQPEAVIYLCANMHVTAAQSKKDKIFNNDNVNWVNDMIFGLADNEHTFYIDVNELFDDAEGNLSTEYSSDAFPIYGKHYMTWGNWLRTKVMPQPSCVR